MQSAPRTTSTSPFHTNPVRKGTKHRADPPRDRRESHLLPQGHPFPEGGRQERETAQLNEGFKNPVWGGFDGGLSAGSGLSGCPPCSRGLSRAWDVEGDLLGKALLPAPVSLPEVLHRVLGELPPGGGIGTGGQGKNGVRFHKQDKPGIYYWHPINSLLKAERQGWEGSKSQLTGTPSCGEGRSRFGGELGIHSGPGALVPPGGQEPGVPAQHQGSCRKWFLLCLCQCLLWEQHWKTMSG